MYFIPVYILILFVTILIDYVAGIYIESAIGKRRLIYLLLSIISTCLVLFIFKYYNFFITNFNELSSFFHWNYSLNILKIILPVGLSFHTFQSLSYVIEVYRGKQKAEHHFGIYALYVMFFPQLVAGPIERPQNMLHQFHDIKTFDYMSAVSGLRQILYGLFKKVFIADRLAIIVNQVYNSPTNFHGLPLIVSTVFFAFQIYCDFSGYSDIAIGSAKIMGFKLMDNFDRPYFSKSLGEFWRKWHISLSTWFKDYLYIPLGGNRVSRIKWIRNIIITFTVSGLWHGANWTYLIWGMLHGVFMVIESLVVAALNKYMMVASATLRCFLDRVKTFGVFAFVSFCWIFFRANSISDAFLIITNMFSGLHEQLSYFGMFVINKISLGGLLDKIWSGVSKFDLIISIITVLGFVFVESGLKLFNYVLGQNKVLRWSVYYIAIILILLFGVFDNAQFIYFQF